MFFSHNSRPFRRPCHLNSSSHDSPGSHRARRFSLNAKKGPNSSRCDHFDRLFASKLSVEKRMVVDIITGIVDMLLNSCNQSGGFY